MKRFFKENHYEIADFLAFLFFIVRSILFNIFAFIFFFVLFLLIMPIKQLTVCFSKFGLK